MLKSVDTDECGCSWVWEREEQQQYRAHTDNADEATVCPTSSAATDISSKYTPAPSHMFMSAAAAYQQQVQVDGHTPSVNTAIMLMPLL